MYLTSTTLAWEPSNNAPAKVDELKFNGVSLSKPKSDDATIGPISSNVALAGGGAKKDWQAKFSNVPAGGLCGNFQVWLTFEADGVTCGVFYAEHDEPEPPPTPIPSNTPTPSNTPAVTNTPVPTATAEGGEPPPD